MTSNVTMAADHTSKFNVINQLQEASMAQINKMEHSGVLTWSGTVFTAPRKTDLLMFQKIIDVAVSGMQQ